MTEQHKPSAGNTPDHHSTEGRPITTTHERVTPPPAHRTSRLWLAKAAPRATYQYFVNGPVDFLLVGGISILMCLIVALLRHRVQAHHLATAAFGLMWVCNWPHFTASGYRLYRSRENIAQYPVTAIVLPLVLLGAMVASIMSPMRIAPYYIKLLILWSPFHFSGQTLGVSLIYAHRAGFRIGQCERTLLAWFIFGTFIAGSARAEVALTRHSYFGISYPTLGLPSYVADVATVGMWVCGIAFLAFVVRWMLVARRPLPWIVLLPAVTQFVWFIPGSHVPGYYEFVPFFHSLQYLLIVWAMQLKEKLDEQSLTPSRHYVVTESLRWGGLNIAIGIGLFWLVPHVLAFTGLNIQLLLGVVGATIQMHHFFVDGVIWKLRNPKVRSPLLVNIDQLIHTESRSGASTT